MKVKITMDRNAPSSAKSSAVQKINRDLGFEDEHLRRRNHR